MVREQDFVSVEREIRALKRPLAAVVHNAIDFGDFLYSEIGNMSQFDAVLQSGLVGVASLTQKLLPLLRESHGRVVGISSGSSFLPGGGNGAYGATKAGLNMFLASLRVEMLPHKVAVLNVVPCFIRTELMDSEAGMKEFFYRQVRPATNAQSNALLAECR